MGGLLKEKGKEEGAKGKFGLSSSSRHPGRTEEGENGGRRHGIRLSGAWRRPGIGEKREESEGVRFLYFDRRRSVEARPRRPTGGGCGGCGGGARGLGRGCAVVGELVEGKVAVEAYL